MASIMLRRRKFWVQYFVPGKSAPLRLSLGTEDPALATLIKEKVEHLVALSDERLLGIELPANILETLPAASMAISAPPPPLDTKGVFITDALSAYYLHNFFRVIWQNCPGTGFCQAQKVNGGTSTIFPPR